MFGPAEKSCGQCGASVTMYPRHTGGWVMLDNERVPELGADFTVAMGQNFATAWQPGRDDELVPPYYYRLHRCGS